MRLCPRPALFFRDRGGRLSASSLLRAGRGTGPTPHPPLSAGHKVSRGGGFGVCPAPSHRKPAGVGLAVPTPGRRPTKTKQISLGSVPGGERKTRR